MRSASICRSARFRWRRRLRSNVRRVPADRRRRTALRRESALVALVGDGRSNGECAAQPPHRQSGGCQGCAHACDVHHRAGEVPRAAEETFDTGFNDAWARITAALSLAAAHSERVLRLTLRLTGSAFARIASATNALDLRRRSSSRRPRHSSSGKVHRTLNYNTAGRRGCSPGFDWHGGGRESNPNVGVLPCANSC